MRRKSSFYEGRKVLTALLVVPLILAVLSLAQTVPNQTDDPDNDGFATAWEILIGTDPNDSESHPSLAEKYFTDPDMFVGYWPLFSNTTEVLHGELNGELKGLAVFQDSAVLLDGKDSYVTFGSDPRLSISSNISYSLWLNNSWLERKSRVIGKYAIKDKQREHCAFIGEDNRLYVFLSSDGTPGEDSSILISSLLPVATKDQWQNISLSWDSASASDGLKCYLNGDEIEMGVITDGDITGLFNGSADLTLGSYDVFIPGREEENNRENQSQNDQTRQETKNREKQKKEIVRNAFQGSMANFLLCGDILTSIEIKEIALLGRDADLLSYIYLDSDQDGIPDVFERIYYGDITHSAPQTTIAIVPPPNISGWNNTDVTVTLSVDDELSDIATTFYQIDQEPIKQGKNISFEQEGIFQISYWSVYDAGVFTCQETPQYVTIRIDKTDPVITSIAPADGSELIELKPQISCTYEDALSGINVSGIHLTLDGQDITAETAITAEQITYTPSENLTAGNHTLELTVADEAGNISQQQASFTILTAFQDDDGDYIDDMWELFNGLDPTDPSDNMSDYDNDSYGAIYEYIHGTDPNNNQSVPMPTIIVTPQQTIQAALDVAQDYDIIQCQYGIYTGPGNTGLDFAGKPVMLTSSSCTIDCQNITRGIKFQDHEDRRTVVNGITFQNAHAEDEWGCVWCDNSSSPTILNCYFWYSAYDAIDCSNGSDPLVKGCKVYFTPWAGIYWEESNPTITDCAFYYCAWGACSWNATAGTVENCTFSMNEYQQIIFWDSAGVTVKDCTIAGYHPWYNKYDDSIFFDNSSGTVENCNITQGHGGIRCFNGSNVSVKNCSVTEARWAGVECNNNSSATVLNSTLQYCQNGVNSSGNSNPQVINCVLKGNNAAFYCKESSPVIINCTVIDCGWWAIGLEANSNLEIINSIFWNNPSILYEADAGNTLSMNYSLVQGGWQGTGNINADPLLQAGTFRLTKNSPCINAGTDQGAPLTDIDGETRDITDIGADEYIDQDNDGLADYLETTVYNSDPASSDSDNDGLTDGEEVYTYNTSPTNSDSDGDGLLDGEEVHTYNTSPTDPDSDNDGMTDGWEIANSLDPLDPSDALLDPDNDGLINLEEYQNSTDPHDSDSDDDELLDGEEVNTYNTDPNNPDSDEDGLSDSAEVNIHNTDPNNPDSDNDGLTDGEEVNIYSTDPNNPDSDGDTMLDGWEVENGLNPLINDSLLDPDNDGFNNVQEWGMATSPQTINNPEDVIEAARAKILYFWPIVSTNQLVFTNAPCSAQDLNDLAVALNSFSEMFYETVQNPIVSRYTYRIDRKFIPVQINVSADVYDIAKGAKNLTGIVGKFVAPISYHKKEEYRGMAVCYPTAQAAWNDARTKGEKISDYQNLAENPGWVIGTKESYGSQSAFIWSAKNHIDFYLPLCYQKNNCQYNIDRVLIGDLEDCLPGTYGYVAWPDMPTNMPAEPEEVICSFDTNCYYQLIYMNTFRDKDCTMVLDDWPENQEISQLRSPKYIFGKEDGIYIQVHAQPKHGDDYFSVRITSPSDSTGFVTKLDEVLPGIYRSKDVLYLGETNKIVPDGFCLKVTDEELLTFNLSNKDQYWLTCSSKSVIVDRGEFAMIGGSETNSNKVGWFNENLENGAEMLIDKYKWTQNLYLESRCYETSSVYGTNDYFYELSKETAIVNGGKNSTNSVSDMLMYSGHGNEGRFGITSTNIHPVAPPVIWSATNDGLKASCELDFLVHSGCETFGDETNHQAYVSKWLPSKSNIFTSNQVHAVLGSCEEVKFGALDDDLSKFIKEIKSGVTVIDAWKNACLDYIIFETRYGILARSVNTNDYIMSPSKSSKCLTPDSMATNLFIYYWYDGTNCFSASYLGAANSILGAELEASLDFAGNIMLDEYVSATDPQVEISADIAEKHFDVVKIKNPSAQCFKHSSNRDRAHANKGLMPAQARALMKESGIVLPETYACSSQGAMMCQSYDAAGNPLDQPLCEGEAVLFNRTVNGYRVLNDFCSLIVSNDKAQRINLERKNIKGLASRKIKKPKVRSNSGIDPDELTFELAFIEKDGLLIPVWVVVYQNQIYIYNAEKGLRYED